MKKNAFKVIVIFILFLTADVIQTISTSDTDEKMENKGNLFAYGFAKTKTVALNFDDGPDAVLTPKLLDLLKEENIKVSFFLIGNKIDTAPEVVKRAYEEGHLIGSS